MVSGESISRADAAVLLGRGDTLLAAGDVAAARLFFERGADEGDAEAALRLGATYDSSFLAQIGLRWIRGDLPKAISWYQRASELGSTEASVVLRRATGR